MTDPTRRTFPPAPSSARALVLSAHPQEDSLNHHLALRYAQAAETAGLPTEVIRVADLSFDPALHVAYRGDQPLEPDLVRVRDALAAAAHLVVVHPTWWASVPGPLKGLFDRVLLPGWAFRYGKHGLPVGGLTGRSARVLTTMGAPLWYDTLVYHRSARRQVARGTLGFCGMAPVHVTAFGNADHVDPARATKIFATVERAAREDARRVTARHAPGVPALSPANP